MPRMFDILRKKADDKKAPPSTPPSGAEGRPQGARFPRQIWKARGKDEPGPGSPPMAKTLIDQIKKKEVDSIEIAEERYACAEQFIVSVLEKASKEDRPLSAEPFYEAVDALVNQLFLGDNLLTCVARQEAGAGWYLPQHLVNVCVLSLALGLQLKFNKSGLHALGMAALLCDLGLAGFRTLTDQPRPLTRDEKNEVRRHPLLSSRFLSRVKGDLGLIKESIEQHHERADGTGYPRGLDANHINEHAKIIGLADSYEAMTHRRPYREAKLPHYALMEITRENKALFDTVLLKAFIHRLSIYPVGSFVRLNTEEVAKVIYANPDSPLRPHVLILIDRFGKHMTEPAALDLSKIDFVYIKEPAVLRDGP